MIGVDKPLTPDRPGPRGTRARLRDRLPDRVVSWPLWTAPAGVVRWLCVVVSVAAGLLTTGLLPGDLLPVGLPAFHITPGQVATVLVLTACGAVCVEAVRRVGEAAGSSNDLLSAWTLPVALLLPPVWSLLVPIVLTVLLQLRVSRAAVHRRVYSAAAIGLSNWLVSVAFHSAWRWHDTVGQDAVGRGALGQDTVGRTVWVGVALGCAALGAAVNIWLVARVVRLAVPGTTWREQVLDREQRVLDVGEICLGVTVAVCWLVTPLLAVAMLVPVLLVQRSLTHAQLRAAARLDAKTGLLNAVAWQEETDREIVRARREGRPLAVLIADIDHFKRVNDAHGHLAGDVALHQAVQALHGQLRPYDQLGRFGGEEFTVLLPGTGHAEALVVAERLRRAVAARPVLLDGVAVDLSVSIGAAVLDGTTRTVTDLLTVADHALYRAKRDGRNRVVVAS